MGRLFAPKSKPEAAPAPPAAPLPPAGLTKDEIKELVTGAVSGVAGQLNETVSRLGQKVEELASRQPQVIVQSPTTTTAREVEISDTEIDQAVLSGQGAAARIRALVDRAVNKATERVIKEHVEPLQNYGVSTIGDLSRRLVTSGMKHYPRFKKEIEAQLHTLPPASQANPVVIETIYNAVVGQHADELANEAAEAAIRKAQEPEGGPGDGRPVEGRSARSASPGTGAGPGTKREGDELPDMDRYLGSGVDAGHEALQHKGSGGQDQDAFARGLGYKDWADYMKMYRELEAAETAGNA